MIQLKLTQKIYLKVECYSSQDWLLCQNKSRHINKLSISTYVTCFKVLIPKNRFNLTGKSDSNFSLILQQKCDMKIASLTEFQGFFLATHCDVRSIMIPYKKFGRWKMLILGPGYLALLKTCEWQIKSFQNLWFSNSFRCTFISKYWLKGW